MLNVSLPQKIRVQFSDIFLHPGLGGLAGKVEDRLKNTWNAYIVYELLLNLILHSRKLTHPTKWESLESHRLKSALPWDGDAC